MSSSPVSTKNEGLQQECGAVTFLVGSGSGSGEVFRLRLRLRLRLKLFGSSGSGSWQNVPAPAALAPAAAPMLKPSYDRDQQYDFQKCQISKHDLLLTWPWVWKLFWMSDFEIWHPLSSKVSGWNWRGHKLLGLRCQRYVDYSAGPKWSLATDAQHNLNIRRRISPKWRFSSVAWPDKELAWCSDHIKCMILSVKKILSNSLHLF